jgi:xylulokinase
MSALLLGIDLGTSYFKAALFDLRGTLKGLGRVAVEKSTPAPGRVELAPTRFWELLRQAVQEALREAEARPGDITGLSYSSQASTFLLLDHQDRPLTPLIIWLDTRGESLEESLVAFSRTSRFHETIGFHGVSGQSAVSKWRWFQQHEPILWGRTSRVMTISDYFSFALTGERVGDAGTASFLGLFDQSRRAWWPAALSAFEIESDKLSSPLLPGSACGQTSVQATDLLGLPAGIPFAVGSLDHHAGAIGAGLERFARLSITTGTVLAALGLVDRVQCRRDCFHGPHFDGKAYFCLAFDPAGAGRLEAYQQQLAPTHSIDRLLALAADSNHGSDPHGPAVRRLLTEIAVTHRTLVERIAGTDFHGSILATGGGARSPLWLQIKADVLGHTMVTSRSPEQGCLGAAIFAAVAGRHYGSLSEAQAAMTEAGDSFLPARHG